MFSKQDFLLTDFTISKDVKNKKRATEKLKVVLKLSTQLKDFNDSNDIKDRKRIAQDLYNLVLQYMEDFEKKPKEQRVPSKEKAKQFVSSFKAEFRPLIKLLMDSIESISLSDIIKHIKRCFLLLPKDHKYVFYCYMAGVKTLKSVMLFELLFAHFALEHGIDIRYFYYNKSKQIRDRILKDEKKTGEKYQFIYVDDVSYSGMQLIEESFDLLKNFPNHKLYAFVYALLPTALSRLHSYVSSFHQKKNFTHQLLCIMCNRIIPSPTFNLLQLVQYNNPFLDYMYMYQLSAEGIYDNVIIFVPEEGENSKSVQTKLIQENKATLLENSFRVFEKYWLLDNSASVLFLNKFGMSSLVVLDYKVPDHISLNPLYFGIIPKEMKDDTVQLEKGKDSSKLSFYMFPLWDDFEKKSYKLKNLNFNEAWYKKIPLNKDFKTVLDKGHLVPAP